LHDESESGQESPGLAAKEHGMIKIEKVLYTAKAHTTGGRDGGHSRTADGRLDVDFALPGAPGNGTNPEQLFASGWSSCFIGAIKRAAQVQKVRLPGEVAVDAEVDLGIDQDGGYGLQARLNVSIQGLDHETAERLVAAAHEICPYSRATRGNIAVNINTVELAHA
jgi:Ohr subfamily peroxiredoxin